MQAGYVIMKKLSIFNLMFFHARIFLFFLLLLTVSIPGLTQPTVTPSFTMPDTICISNPLRINNTTVGAQSSFWNFCVADLKQPPIGTNLGNMGGRLNMPVFMDYVMYNNNWYGFSTNHGTGTLVRHDFGNSLLNTPVSTDLGNFGGAIPGPFTAEGIQVVYNESKWYAIITCTGVSAADARILKVEFGADLTNPAPVATNWGNMGAGPNSDLHVFKDGTNWFGITLNSAGELLRFDFSNSFNNTPTVSNLGAIGPSIFPTGLFVINDNGFWRLFVINSGDDFRGNPTSNSSIIRLDFGNSLLNTPAIVSLGNPGNVLRHPRDITIIRTCEQTVGFIVNGNTNQPSVSRMDFNNGLGQAPAPTDLGDIGNLSFAHGISKLFRVNEDLYAFVTNVTSNSITRLRFAGCNSASLPSFNGHTPPPITYNAPGTYNINLTIDDGLPTQQSICKQVVVEAAPVSTVTTRYLCPGQTINIATSNTRSKYLWNNGATSSSINVNAPGIYYVDVDKFGCTATDTIKVAYYKEADFNFTQNICNPQEVNFAVAGTGLSNLRWNFGDGNTATGAGNVNHQYAIYGTYTVSLTAFNGSCDETVSKTIKIDVGKEDLIKTIDTTICFQTTARLQTRTVLDFCWFPTTYLDDPRSPNPVTSTPNDITYYFNAKVTDANLIVNGDFSAGNTGFITDYHFSTQGYPEGDYGIVANPNTWHNGFSACTDHTSGSGNMMIVNGSAVLNMVVWKQTINVTPHTNYAFATWIMSAISTNPAQLQFSINDKNLSGMISAPGTTCNWTQFYTTWNSGNSTTATIAIVNQNLQAAGNDFALDDISFAEVLIKRDSVKITVEKPVVTASNDTTICIGSEALLKATGAVDYSWSPSADFQNPGTQNAIAKPKTRTEYTVTGKNARGCIAEDKVWVDLHPEINITKTPDTTVCRFTSFPITVGGGIGYSWEASPNLLNISTDRPTVNAGLDKMKFRVKVRDIHTCEKLDSVQVSIFPYPVFAAAAAQQYICLGKSVSFTAIGGDRYSWSPAASIDDPASDKPVATPDINTLYSVHIQDNTCGFDSTISMNITVNPLPSVWITKSNDIDCNTPTTVLTASGGMSYNWLPADKLDDPTKGNPVAAVDTTTLFQVWAKNQYGCESSSAIKVYVSQTGIPRFVLPNAFTPNGDGRNDCFGIKRWGDAKVEEFAVFNRWGQLVFRTNNPGICWDGMFNGKPAPAGAYAYLIKTKTICGIVNKRGLVMLIR